MKIRLLWPICQTLAIWWHVNKESVIKEQQIPSPIDILMKMQSSGNLSDFVSGIVKDFIQASIVQKSVIEKPTNNP